MMQALSTALPHLLMVGIQLNSVVAFKYGLNLDHFFSQIQKNVI